MMQGIVPQGVDFTACPGRGVTTQSPTWRPSRLVSLASQQAVRGIDADAEPRAAWVMVQHVAEL